jgi:hypothetical protein
MDRKETRYLDLKARVKNFAQRALTGFRTSSPPAFFLENFARPGSKPYVVVHLENGDRAISTTFAPRDFNLRRLKPIRRNIGRVLSEMNIQEKNVKLR